MGLGEATRHITILKSPFLCRPEKKYMILTACPSSSVSASSGVEDEGESDPCEMLVE